MREVALRDKHHLTNQEGVRSAHRTDLCFSICRFSQVVLIPRTQRHAQSLFLFPIVFVLSRVTKSLVNTQLWGSLRLASKIKWPKRTKKSTYSGRGYYIVGTAVFSASECLHGDNSFLWPRLSRPPPPLEAILVIFGRRDLIFFV